MGDQSPEHTAPVELSDNAGYLSLREVYYNGPFFNRNPFNQPSGTEVPTSVIAERQRAFIDEVLNNPGITLPDVLQFLSEIGARELVNGTRY